MRWVLLISVGLLLIAGGVFLASRGQGDKSVVLAPATAPATAPSTAPVVTAEPTRPREYMDVLRLHYPDFPTTRPLIVPVTLPDSARILIPEPLYLDSIGELWITRPDAESTSAVFKTVHQQSTHVLREHVVFVHRWPDDKGVWQPQLICRKDDGKFEIVTRGARQDIAGSHVYDWPRAFSWNDAIVVPTDHGVSILRPQRLPMELHQDLVPTDQFDAQTHSPVQVLLDWRGLLAWMPWENLKRGSKGAVRFVDEKFTVLDSTQGWPEMIVQLVPLLDGSVLQLARDAEKNVGVVLSVLDTPQVDRAKINALVDQLSNVDSEKRQSAFAELTRYGKGIWPILEELQKQDDNRSAEARARLDQLLAAKTQPMLGGMVVEPGPIEVLARSRNGGVVLNSGVGVLVRRPDSEEPMRLAPAVLSIQPGEPVTLATDTLTQLLIQPNEKLHIVQGEWFLEDADLGLRWWASNHLSAPLLKGDDLQYRYLVGQDGRGRWLFRKSPTDLSPTLVIDPTLPDPKPKLPVWVFAVTEGEVGWTDDNRAAIKHGSAWQLEEFQWRPVDEAKSKYTSAGSALPPPKRPIIPPTTAPTSAEVLGEPILVEADGTRFFDGRNQLHMQTKDGQLVSWTLPQEAIGSIDPILLRASENRLFLSNAAGRLLRIKQNEANASEPFKLEATFTKRIPNDETPNRLWVDPNGRIVFAVHGNVLAICFPEGRIPKELMNVIPANELEEILNQ